MKIHRLIETVAGLFRLQAFFPLVFLYFSACASYTEETREIRSSYMARSYTKALEVLDMSSLKESSNNRLLYLLERAMILDRMGQRDRSRNLLIESDKLADQLYTVSVGRTALSFVMNDSSSDYSGEDYEKVAIHTEMALSFIDDNNLDSARVEARKINSKLNEIVATYGDKKTRYSEDAFALYLAATIYEAREEYDDAIIDYTKALNLYEGSYRELIRGGVPQQLIRSLYGVLHKRKRSDRIAEMDKKYQQELKGTAGQTARSDEYGDVVVIHERGHIAVKVTKDFVMGIGKQVVRFSWPVIQKTSRGGYQDSGLSVEGGEQVTAENVQDMDAIASVCLDDRRLRMIAKQAARLLAKGQLTEQAYKNFGPLGGIAANIFSAVSETADTRSWTLLPESYYISRLRLKPGTHTVRIKTGGRQSRVEKIEIKKGKLVLLRDVG